MTESMGESWLGRWAAGTLLAAALWGAGCASSVGPPAVASDAELGRVIVYRNGVAYFERYAEAQEEQVRLQVPTERVDDFLKSLTVTDEASGRPLPVRYPTLQSGQVAMTIALPEQHGRVRITYVTESPAWKPTYRVILGDGDEGTLQGWAIVDNVTDEDWRKVRVGVGTTSALSFRYDLHSVRMVQRQELNTGAPLAIAPPVGGSPYGVAGREVLVLGSLDAAAIAGLPNFSTPGTWQVRLADATPQERLDMASGFLDQVEAAIRRVSRQLREARQQSDVVRALCTDDKLTQLHVALRSAGERLRKLEQAVATGNSAEAQHEHTTLAVLLERAQQLEAESHQCIGHEPMYIEESSVVMEVDPDLPPAEEPERVWTGPELPEAPEVVQAPEAPVGEPPVHQDAQGLVARLRQSTQPIRIEGFAPPGATDLVQASLARAQAARAKLIAAGIPGSRIEAVGTGVVDEDRAVRIVAANGPASSRPVTAEAERQAHATQPLDGALFVGREPVTIGRGQSAMVSLFQQSTRVERVYLYDPVSDRGSRRFTFNALRIVNPTEHTLESGPVTVYGGAQFLGEGLSEPVGPGATAIVPYALDRTVIVDPEHTERDRIEKLLGVEQGVVTAQCRRIRSTKLTLTNRGRRDATVYVRHSVADGYRLVEQPHDVQKLGASHVLRARVEAGERVELVIEQWKPQRRKLDVRSAEGIAAIAVHLDDVELAPAVAQQLQAIVRTHRRQAELSERIAGRQRQLAVYRQRIDEINVQLVSLRQVPQAARLRRHLASRMQDISERLQQATFEATSLEGELMTARIELQDQIAALTLPQSAEAVAVDPPADGSGPLVSRMTHR